MIIINDTLGTYGGSITLISRLCTWASTHGVNISVFSDDCSNKEIVRLLKGLGISVCDFDTTNLKALYQKTKDVMDSSSESIIFVSFILNNYLNVEYIKRKYKLNIVNTLYSIHPATLYKGTGLPIKFLKKMVINRYRKLVDKINSSGCLLYMDQDNVDSAENYYNIHFSDKTTIIPLPFIVDNLEPDIVNKKAKAAYKAKTIITSTRADFPFKGYVFGLIDDYKELSEKFDIKLVIVASGEKEDVEELNSKVSSLPEKCRSNVTLYSWMQYDKLKELISNSYLYVGMGTGILDAAAQYVPAIPVKYDTYDNISDHDFIDDPLCLITNQDVDQPARKIIEEYLSLSEIEYVKKCFLSHDKASSTYDVKCFFDELLKQKTTNSVFSFKEAFTYKTNHFVNKFKKKKKYSCSNIEYEEDIG